MHPPIPVSVLTGFLGAGKTTLLNRLLREPGLADTAVIINEFGDVSIDHLLVESSSDGVIQLADGCICCTVRGELVDTLADLIDRHQTGRIGRLARIVIETTGLANPGPVVAAIMGHPALLQALRLDGVIAVVDAVNGSSTLDCHEEAVRQVAIADRIVLTKTDMDGADTAGTLTARLEALNGRAEIVPARDADFRALFDCGLYDPASRTADPARWLSGAKAHDTAHHHHGHHHHHHHHGVHDSRVRSHSLIHDGPAPFAAIETFVDLLRSLHGERLLRMKGIVEIAEDPGRPLVVHGVQKVFHPPARLPEWPAGPRGVRIVLITIDVPDDYVARLFRAVTGRPSVDEADRTALADNPLAIAGFRV